MTMQGLRLCLRLCRLLRRLDRAPRHRHALHMCERLCITSLVRSSVSSDMGGLVNRGTGIARTEWDRPNRSTLRGVATMKGSTLSVRARADPFRGRVMQLQLTGEPHDQTRSYPSPPRSTQDHLDDRSEAAMTRVVRRQPQEKPHPRRSGAHLRHALGPRMAGYRADCHCHRRRVRMASATLQIAVGDRARHHRHTPERLDVLRAE